MSLLRHTLTLTGVGFVVILFFSVVQPFYSLNLWLTDQLFVSKPPSTNIVIIGIDDDSLETFGRWTDWPRSLHARAIDNLSKAGAGVIGLDILFTDSSAEDEMLAGAIKRAGNVVLPLIGTGPQPSSRPEINYAHILSPAPPLAEPSSNIGHANLSPDPDGRVRRLPLVITDSGGQAYPAYSLAVLHTLFAVPLPQAYQRQEGALHILDRDIPVDANYLLRINFTPENAGRPYLSYKDVISGDFDPAEVENKIVLIGMTATGELDKWAVPVSPGKVPGVYIHAVTIDNILGQQFLTEVSTGTNLAVLLLLVGVTGLALPRLGLRWGGIAAGALSAGYLVASFLAFENGYILNILYPLLTLPVIYVSNILIQNAATVIQNARLRQNVLDGYKSTIKALAASIDAKDHYTRGHSERVTEYALLGATSLQMSQEELDILENAGILHDIGKIGIPDGILGKPGPLTPAEWDIIRQHPLIGANIVKDIPFLEESARFILYHHERYDGAGYPDGIKGNDIPLGARLLAVADAFDSMTSSRAYRDAMRLEDALSELQTSVGTQFCPVAIEAFVSAFNSRAGKPPTGHF